MRIFGALIAVGLLAGCSSAPISLADAKPVMAVGQFQAAAPGTAPVVVRRDTGFGGGGCTTTLYVNGEAAGRINTGEMVTIHAPVGGVILGASNTSAMCPNALVEQEVVLEEGKPRHFRVGVDQSGSLGLFRTNAI
jgi:hypothetical protein